MFDVGDWVIVFNTDSSNNFLRGKAGVVVYIDGDTVGVEFPFRCKGGGPLGGACPSGNGIWLKKGFIRKIFPVKQLLIAFGGVLPYGHSTREAINL